MSSHAVQTSAKTTAHYIQSFLDLVEEVPLQVQRHMSCLHQLNNAYLKCVDRTEHIVHKYNRVVALLAQTDRFSATHDDLNRSRLELSKRLETQLIQIQEVSDEKLSISELIFDLIETKAKELDLDYEEVLQLTGKVLDNKSVNGDDVCQKVCTTSAHSGSALKEVNDKKYESEDNCLADKRWLPRRACAVKSGQTPERMVSNETEAVSRQSTPSRTTSARVAQKKSIKTKSFSKSHGFGHSMSNFYRQMARRRSKLPQKSSKISAKASGNGMQSKANKSSVGKQLSDDRSDVKSANNSHSVQPVVRSRKTAVIKTSTTSSSSSSDNEIAAKSSAVCDTKPNGQAKSGKRESTATSKTRSAASGQSQAKRSKSGHESASSQSSDQFYGEPIDPNEPTYCLCQQVSFGNMIGCDNTLCAIEWFHFPCVGLEPAFKPKGKWFCPDCRKAPKLYGLPKRTKD